MFVYICIYFLLKELVYKNEKHTQIKGYGLGCVLLVRPPSWMSCLLLAALWPCMDARAGIPENLQDVCLSASKNSRIFYESPNAKNSRNFCDCPIPSKPSKPGHVTVARQRASQARLYGSFFTCVCLSASVSLPLSVCVCLTVFESLSVSLSLALCVCVSLCM